MSSRVRPAPPRRRASHWRRSTGWPKKRCAITASETAPPARTACTREIGAIERAATWASQAIAASPQPAANQGEAASPRTLRTGRWMQIGSVSWQPRAVAHLRDRRDRGAAGLGDRVVGMVGGATQLELDHRGAAKPHASVLRGVARRRLQRRFHRPLAPAAQAEPALRGVRPRSGERGGLAVDPADRDSASITRPLLRRVRFYCRHDAASSFRAIRGDPATPRREGSARRKRNLTGGDFAAKPDPPTVAAAAIGRMKHRARGRRPPHPLRLIRVKGGSILGTAVTGEIKRHAGAAVSSMRKEEKRMIRRLIVAMVVMALGAVFVVPGANAAFGIEKWQALTCAENEDTPPLGGTIVGLPPLEQSPGQCTEA